MNILLRVGAGRRGGGGGAGRTHPSALSASSWSEAGGKAPPVIAKDQRLVNAQAIGACHTTRLGQTSRHEMGPAATWPSFPSAGRGLAFLAC